MSPLLSALGILQRKTPPPPLAPVPWVGIQVAPVVYKPPGIGIGSLLSSFGDLQAEWQICLPLGPALVAPVSSHGRLFALPSSAPLSAACLNILYSSTRQWGCPFPTWSVLQGTAAHPLSSQFPGLTCLPWLPALVARALSLLLPYLLTINL